METNGTIAKKILDCKKQFWLAVDSDMLKNFFTLKERDILRDKFLLRKLPNINVYILWIPRPDIKDELFVLMNKFHILKYYQIKFNTIFSPKTYFDLLENSESLLKFKLLSFNNSIVDKIVKTWQLTIEIVSASNIYSEITKKSFIDTLFYSNLNFPIISKAFYLLFHKLNPEGLTQNQVDFLKSNFDKLDSKVWKIIKNFEPKKSEFNEIEFKKSQFKFLDTYKNKIDSFKKQLKDLNLSVHSPFSSNKDYFEYINNQKIKDIYNTTTIEGEEVSYKELLDYLDWNKELFKKKPQKLQIVGYEEAFQEVLANKITLDEDGIKRIHYDIFYPIYEFKFVDKPTGGIYSNSQRYINYKTPYMHAYNISPMVPPSPDKVPYLMDLLDKFLKEEKDLNAFEKAIIFHIIFIEIHPFQDWNWRTARLFFNRIISEERLGWVVIPWEERDTYFDQINTAIQDSDILPFAKYYYDKLIHGNKEITIFKP